MINKVTLIGYLGRDPEIRHFEGGNKVARFSIATHENYQDRTGQWQSNTEWHNIVIWGNGAERAERQLKKGHLIYIEGKITTNKWQDKDGNDRYSTDIRANIFRSLERREGSDAALPGGGEFTSIDDHFTTATGKDDAVADSPEALPPKDDLPF